MPPAGPVSIENCSTSDRPRESTALRLASSAATLGREEVERHTEARGEAGNINMILPSKAESWHNITVVYVDLYRLKTSTLGANVNNHDTDVTTNDNTTNDDTANYEDSNHNDEDSDHAANVDEGFLDLSDLRRSAPPALPPDRRRSQGHTLHPGA